LLIIGPGKVAVVAAVELTGLIWDETGENYGTGPYPSNVSILMPRIPNGSFEEKMTKAKEALEQEF
jgi:hypothetical protein